MAAVLVTIPGLWESSACGKSQPASATTSRWVFVSTLALSVADAGLLFAMALSTDTLGASAAFVTFHALTEFLLVIVAAILGREMVSWSRRGEDPLLPPGPRPKDVHFATVFGANSLVGMVFQIIVQAVLEATGAALDTQFWAFGWVIIATVGVTCTLMLVFRAGGGSPPRLGGVD